jgi:hypothetical protein
MAKRKCDSLETQNSIFCLKFFIGLNKIGVLGQAGVHKVMLMAAIAFNLKKYLKKGGRKPSCTSFEAIIDTLKPYLLAFTRNK